MSEPKKFSFSKPGAAASAAKPVEVIVPAAPSVPTEPDRVPSVPDTNLPAVPPPAGPPAFYVGGDDEPTDPSDIRLPRLNIVQKSSAADWLKHGVFSLILKGEVLISTVAKPFRMVVMGARPKVYIEKVRYLGDQKARFARSIDEVVKLGGTDQWKFSKENPAVSSPKPWFMPSVTLAVLIEKPADCKPDHEGHFAYVVDGKAYAAALLSVKSTNYDAVWIFLSSERKGVLSHGFNSRFIDGAVNAKAFKGGESGVFKLSFGPETSAAMRELATKIVSGN